MTFNIIGLFCFALVELGIPTVVSKIIDDGIAKQDIAYVWWMGLIILILALIGSAGTVLLIYASSKISMRPETSAMIFSQNHKHFLMPNMINLEFRP